jgi:NAD(P)-dependent dehydrogenase (short-subunit alcohol dehydrogenase family)
MNTLAVVGAGPGLGLAIAKRFGASGLSVALIARSQDKLDACVGELEALGVTAAAFPADVTDRAGLGNALRSAEAALGPIDVLEYSPTSGATEIAAPLDMTAENTQPQIEVALHGAIAAVQTVLPGMRERGRGALLFTTGASSWNLTPMMGNAGVALAGLRNYAHGLHEYLAPEGIYVGHVCVDLLILPSAGEVDADAIMAHPDAVAAYHWQLFEERDRFEVKIGNFSGNPMPLEDLAELLGQPLSD